MKSTLTGEHTFGGRESSAMDPSDAKSNFKVGLARINQELWLVLSLFVIAGLFNWLVASHRMILGLYTLPTIFSAYVYGRRHAVLTASAELRGRRLLTPKGIRPSQGVVKEAIFNILAQRVIGARVIDLFAGSGALGIEALSRGAAEATFVELEGPALGTLKRNLEAVGVLDRAQLVHSSVARWLQLHEREVGEAELIMLDPPYDDPVLAPTLAALDRLATGTVVLEWSGRGPLPEFERLEVRRDKAYGATRLTILTPR